MIPYRLNHSIHCHHTHLHPLSNHILQPGNVYCMFLFANAAAPDGTAIVTTDSIANVAIMTINTNN